MLLARLLAIVTRVVLFAVDELGTIAKFTPLETDNALVTFKSIGIARWPPL